MKFPEASARYGERRVNASCRGHLFEADYAYLVDTGRREPLSRDAMQDMLHSPMEHAKVAVACSSARREDGDFVLYSQVWVQRALPVVSQEMLDWSESAQPRALKGS